MKKADLADESRRIPGWVLRLMWTLPVVSIQRKRTCGLVKIDQVPNSSLFQDSRAGSIQQVAQERMKRRPRGLW